MTKFVKLTDQLMFLTLDSFVIFYGQIPRKGLAMATVKMIEELAILLENKLFRNFLSNMISISSAERIRL